jgi:type IV secretory pathway VirB2 component (pilin)
MKFLKNLNALLGMFLLNAFFNLAHAATPGAGGSGLPWEAPLDTILQSVQGPVARVFILIAVIVTGLGMAFGEHGSGFKKVMGIAFGGAIVIGAVAFLTTLFGAGF